MCRGTSSLGKATIPSGNSGKSRTIDTGIQSRPDPVFGAMPTTALVWFRRDLRVHDHPPLREALADHARIVPVFVLDDRLLEGRFASGNRTRFLLECLRDLREALDGNLVVAQGRPEEELPRLAREYGARAVYYAADHSPFARRRDDTVDAALDAVD